MSITSFYFFVFCIIGLGIYHVLPQKVRWVELLILSIAFYMLNAPIYTFLYLLTSILSVFCAGVYLGKSQEKENRNHKLEKFILWLVIIINIGLLSLLKYNYFFISNVNTALHIFGVNGEIKSLDLIASLGVSYYTFQLVGYLCDVYWGTIKPQRNVLKLMLFGSYFPQMVSGPISRYKEIESDLYAGNKITYDELISGIERFLWGLFKKLVVAGRLGAFVAIVYDSPNEYSAIYIWIAMFAFAIQLYADFSGCMDIVLGLSECFGIKLPENFNAPFFSENIQEFWQRWHMTLGAWFKNYVMYPFLNTGLMKNCEKTLKERIGKKRGKRYNSYIGMLLVWLGIGLWHGSGWKFILGEGIWFWMMIILGKELKPLFDKINSLLKINTEVFSWKLFRSVRTFVIFSIGMLFFRADSLSHAFNLLRLSITQPKITAFTSIIGIGLDARGWFIVLVGMFAMLLVDYLHTKGSVRRMLNGQNLFFKWIVLMCLIFAVIIWGQYGPGFDAADFIYQGF